MVSDSLIMTALLSGVIFISGCGPDSNQVKYQVYADSIRIADSLMRVRHLDEIRSELSGVRIDLDMIYLIDESVSLSRTLVTQKLWQDIMGNNPSIDTCQSCPVTNINLNDISSFLYRLNTFSGKKYRIPTQNLLEYALKNNYGLVQGNEWTDSWDPQRDESIKKYPRTYDAHDREKLVREIQAYVKDKISYAYSGKDPDDRSNRGFRICEDSNISMTKTPNNQIEINHIPDNYTSYNNVIITVNDYPIEMVYVKGGSFNMGDNTNKDSWEYPSHKVYVKDFYIAKYELTTELAKSIFKGTSVIFSSDSQKDNLPIITTYLDALYNVEKLKEITEHKFRLPTEAEWEYAAKGGCLSNGFVFSGSNNAERVGWTTKNSSRIMPVGRALPNELGIYDMSGNVWELCSDNFQENYYQYSPVNNPQGPVDGTAKAVRGGSYSTYDVTTVKRSWIQPNERRYDVGIRLALDIYDDIY